MKRVTKKLFCIIFLLSISILSLFAEISGSGSLTDPFILSDKNDWDTFADNINMGINADKYYKLSDSFNNSAEPITKMAGNNNSYPFQGSFDGNGKSLVVNISETGSVAPFSWVKDASFVNLCIEGNIEIQGDSMGGGGFVGSCVSGYKVSFENCISKVTITATKDGDGSHGGFIGYPGNSPFIVFNNCAFIGAMKGSNTTCCGGFVGWAGSEILFNNCLFAPKEMSLNEYGGAVFNRGTGGIYNNCYYTFVYFQTQQGLNAVDLSNEELLSNLGDNWEIYNSEVLPIIGPNLINVSEITDLKTFYIYTGTDIPLEYSCNMYEKELTKDIDFDAIIKNENKEIVTSCVEKGNYTLTIKGKGNFKGAKEVPFIVCFEGDGTEENPYLIENAFDWNNYAKFTQSYSDLIENLFVSLKNDVSFENQSFKSLTNSCSVVFNGNGFSISDINQGCEGIFSENSSKGVIKNLWIKNVTFTGSRYSGIIVGHNYGTITNCHVENTVYLYSGDTPNAGESSYVFCHGGVAGYNYSSGVISGCTSGATVKARHGNNNYYGGIVGYNIGLVKHCLYYGDQVYSTAGSYGAISGNSSGTYKLCLNLCKSLYAVSNSNNNEATFAYSLSIKNDEIELIPDSDDYAEYGAITYTSGLLLWEKTLYAPASLQVNLDLEFLDKTINKEDIVCEYKYKSGTQTLYDKCGINAEGKFSFVMPDSDVFMYPGIEWSGEGNEESPYRITNIYQLKFLAVRVNDFEQFFENKIFVLDNDITGDNSINNYISIGGCFGGQYKEFCGTFDGSGHFISGINISNTENLEQDTFLGIFGRIGSSGRVENLNLKNCIIKGHFSVGGIAGYNNGVVYNCKVEKDVYISYEKTSSSCHGGIVGYNEGLIDSCKSFAQVESYSVAGGITGYNKGGEINNCFYCEEDESGVVALSSYAGFISGHFEDGQLSDNYYIGKKLYALGTISSGKDDDGAKKLFKISSYLGQLSLTDDSNYFTYNSDFYAPAGSLIKVEIEAELKEDNTVIGMAAMDLVHDNFPFETESNYMYSFTMPLYDVAVSRLVRVVFETNGASAVDSQYLLLGSTVKSVENPVLVNTEGKVFEGWYIDSKFTQIFDPEKSLNENLTLYANFCNGKNLYLKEDPCNPGIYYASFYSSSFNYKVDNNSQIYYVTGKKNGKLSVESEISGIINAGKGVIIKSSMPLVSLVITESKGKYSYENLLTGTDNSISSKEGAYILGFNKKGGIGFYAWNGPIEANRAFLLMEDINE